MPWLLRVDGPDLDGLALHLAPDERTRAAAMRSPRRRAEYVAGRVLAKYAYGRSHEAPNAVGGGWRAISSHDLLRSPELREAHAYAVVSNERGAPTLVDTRTGRHERGISISHQWPFGAAAFRSTGHACGVDVARVGSVSPQVAQHYLAEAPALAARLPKLNEAQRLALLWSIKEASFKALRSESTRVRLNDVRVADVRAPDVPLAAETTYALGATIEVGRCSLDARVNAACFGRTMCSEVRW
jgi:4'-phosphopantetheinyl transferase EntD